MIATNIYGAWAAKQTAKGSPATVATRRFIQVGGDVVTNPDFGSEDYSDLDKFGNSTDWVNSIQGGGTPGLEASVTELAWLSWIFHGQEVVTPTGAPDPVGLQRHRFEPSPVPGFWFTWWKRVGDSGAAVRQKFNDCRIGQLVIEASSANKAVRMTPTIMSVDPGENFTVDPTPPMPDATSPVMIFTEAAGTWTINGNVMRGHSQVQLTLSEALGVVFGDSAAPYEVARTGKAAAGLGATIQGDTDAIAHYNREVYGTATPAAGAKPLSRVPLLGSYSFKMDKLDPTTGLLIARLQLNIPGIRWQPVENFAAANPGGGTQEVALTGQLRKVGSNPLYTLDVVTAAGVTAFSG
jgi:hypothetical protein